MRNRTTKKNMTDALAALNAQLGVKEGEEDSFCLQGAYGGWQLCRHWKGDISIGGFKSKREVYEMIHNITYGVLLAKRRMNGIAYYTN
jgi:hypothetical protein